MLSCTYMYRIDQKDKLKMLINADKNIFSSSDIATIWGITNKNTLWTTLKRYVQNKTLHRIKKGMFSKIEPSKLDPFEIGCALSGPFSYVSLETVLSQNGVIMQNVKKITLVGDREMDFKYENISFLVRKMNSEFLFNRVGIKDEKKYSIASLERAVVDIQYYNPKYFFDNESPITWGSVSEIKELVGY